MKKMTQLQKEAMKDAITHGELHRNRASDDFEPGHHRGQTIGSLIVRKMLDVTDASTYGWPMRVKPIAGITWDDID